MLGKSRILPRGGPGDDDLLCLAIRVEFLV